MHRRPPLPHRPAEAAHLPCFYAYVHIALPHGKVKDSAQPLVYFWRLMVGARKTAAAAAVDPIFHPFISRTEEETCVSTLEPPINSEFLCGVDGQSGGPARRINKAPVHNSAGKDGRGSKGRRPRDPFTPTGLRRIVITHLS